MTIDGRASVRRMIARREQSSFQLDDLASRGRANCPRRSPSVFRTSLKCSSPLGFDALAHPMLTGYWGTSAMWARVVFQSRPRIKQVIRVVARAAFLVALLMPWLAILAWLYSRVAW